MHKLEAINPIVRPYIKVKALFEAVEEPLSLRALNSVSLDKEISDKNIHRPQLALAGYTELFTHHRIQVIGNTEIYYLRSLSDADALEAFERLCDFDIPCFIVSNNHELPPAMVEAATRQAIPLFCTPLETTEAIFKVSQFLEWQFAPRINVHGSFVDVYGVGLLFIGRSGIGKSEIVLDLVERGHRLVADDVVVLTRKRDGVIVGSGTNLVRHFMEIRGLGLIDIRQMFGVRAIRNQKRLEIIVQLEEWDSNVEYTRTGLDAEPLTILDTNVDFVRLPITPGKNVTVIAEVIAMSYLLNQHGYNSAAEFSRKLTDEIRKKSRSPKEGSDRDPDIYLYDVDTE